MNDKQLRIKEVKSADQKNNNLIQSAKNGLSASETAITNGHRRIEQLEREHKQRVQYYHDQINRAIKNAKLYQDEIDELLIRKEALHDDLKTAIHFGEKRCPHCNHYFSPQGYSRHESACSMKPANKAVEEHKEVIDTARANLEARKVELEKQLEELQKKT